MLSFYEMVNNLASFISRWLKKHLDIIVNVLVNVSHTIKQQGLNLNLLHGGKKF